MLSKNETTSRENSFLREALQSVEAYIDGKLQLGERQFTTSVLFNKTTLPSSYKALFVDMLTKHYRKGDWEVRRDYGDQLDPYDVLTFT